MLVILFVLEKYVYAAIIYICKASTDTSFNIVTLGQCWPIRCQNGINVKGYESV